MKFVISLLILNIALSVCSSISLSISSSAKTDLNFKLSTVSRSKFELTFSASNSTPESTKMLENVITKRSVRVQARVSIIGEENSNLDSESNKVSFSDGSTNLRFKQNEQHYDFKNMEAPEIRKVIKETHEENIESTGAIHLANRFFSSERNASNDLLLQFKEIMGRTLHSQNEIVSDSKYKIIEK